jgi:hypothetical protein
VAGRIEPRFDRTTGTLDVLGAWGETTGVEEPLAALEQFLRR